MRNTVMNVTDILPVTIANGQSLSGGVSLGGLRLFGVVMPSGWTAANLTFQASVDGGASWVNLYDANGSEVTVTAGTSRFIALEPALFASLTHLQLRSGTSATPVAQGADRSLSLVLRSV